MLLLVNGSSKVQVSELNRSELVEDRGPEAVVVPLVFGLIFVVGVLGNSLVMVVMAKVGKGVGGRRGRRPGSPTSVFVVNLSAADLLFLLLCVPFHATVYSLPDWVFGAFLCRAGHYFLSVSMLVSIFTLAAMSVDRYVAVVRSGRSPCRRSHRNALTGVCIIWILALLCSVPVAQHQALIKHPTAPNSTFCWELWSGTSRRVYKVTILLLGYLLPLLVISCCYTKVLFHLHHKMKNMSKKSECSKRKTTQTVLLLVAAFTICWTPHHIIAMWVEFATFPLSDASFVFRIVSHCLSYGNSCVNPALYAFMSHNFRQACRQVFTPPASGAAIRLRRETLSTTQPTTTI